MMVNLEASDQEVAAIMGGRPQLDASAGAGAVAAGKGGCEGDQPRGIGTDNSHSGGCKAAKAGEGARRADYLGGVGDENRTFAI